MQKDWKNTDNYEFLKVLLFLKQRKETFDQNFARLNKKLRKLWKVWENFWDFLLKTQWKIDFLDKFWQFLTDIFLIYTALEDNIIFLQQFFPFRGEGNFPPVPPLATPMITGTCALFMHKFSYLHQFRLNFLRKI